MAILLKKLQYSLKTRIEKLSQWLIAKRLTINPQKSSILPICPTMQSTPLSLEININQHTLKSCDTLKYLEIILDHQLNFKRHNLKTTKQFNRATGILWKVRKFLPEKYLLSSHYDLIQPYLLYRIIAWGSISPSSVQQSLQLAKNDAIKAIVGAKKFDHVMCLYKKL